MGVIVKRFRTLGQIQRRSLPELKSVEPDVSNIVKPMDSDLAKRRSRKKKHQYPLRAVNSLWFRIFDFNVSCRGVDFGPSLNETLCDLLESALNDEGIVKSIQDKYPDRDQIVIVRTWERG